MGGDYTKRALVVLYGLNVQKANIEHDLRSFSTEQEILPVPVAVSTGILVSPK
jgi:hypothetical protein